MGELTILMVADEVRAKTLKLLEATPEDWLLWTPPGTQNHIAWHSGHALWVADALCIQSISGRSELPPGWAETFGMNGRLPAQTPTWPAKVELLARLRTQHGRLRTLLGALDGADPQTLRRIIHGFHDEANHQGEMYLLLKIRRTLG
jgi:hypothetical protein